MSENESALGEGTAKATEPEASTEEITYHAVEKDGVVTAIWEMQGRKHLRTIDPRSRQDRTSFVFTPPSITTKSPHRNPCFYPRSSVAQTKFWGEPLTNASRLSIS